ncbi:cytochrome c [Ovoidimarina sediminis]|uniref:cytochrome c n=1 Tax=Ovoidimarina sediminis TaxID=3079856 RepID=UPI0029069A23|nr:cytochrome c [Rhodophyticola sp. MJ-SS7]MDU8941922.1 cytochrome c [Rhodophyticola sp. MJ-SS7]
MRRILAVLAALILIGAAGLFALTRPATVPEAAIAAITPDLARGEAVFHAAGCASCHAADGAEGEARLILSGGHSFATPAGTFVAPNISQDPEHGIGAWSKADIVTAVMKGTSPDGRHYFPAFPYAAYAKAELSDIVSLAAYLKTLPADPTPSQPHDLAFPYSIRMGVGAWKLLGVSEGFAVDLPDDPQIRRGQYLAEALAHCGECHTPRTATQALDTARWFAGAPNPSGKGSIPNISPAKLSWSAADIAAYLKSGFTPEFDAAGGSMRDVITSLANLPDEDLAAIAAYLKAVPPAE